MKIKMIVTTIITQLVSWLSPNIWHHTYTRPDQKVARRTVKRTILNLPDDGLIPFKVGPLCMDTLIPATLPPLAAALTFCFWDL